MDDFDDPGEDLESIDEALEVLERHLTRTCDPVTCEFCLGETPWRGTKCPT